MKKISIVGVEGSGKTVLMSVLGDVYSVPNKDGLFLNPQNKETFEYCAKTVADMRKGYWPQVTEPGQVVDLQWSLCRAKDGRHQNLNVFAVSAVKETVLDDMAIEIPTQDFHSVGLDGLIKWMVNKGRRQWLNLIKLIWEHAFCLLVMVILPILAGAFLSYGIFQTGKENFKNDLIEISLYIVSFAILLIVSIVVPLAVIVNYIKNPREVIKIFKES